MSTDEANDCIPEHLAKFRKITREYLTILRGSDEFGRLLSELAVQ